MTTDYSPFNGDGRVAVEPQNEPEGTRGNPIRNAQARMIIDMFLKQNRSYHSQVGATVWVIVTWLKARGWSWNCETQRDEDGRPVGFNVTGSPQ